MFGAFIQYLSGVFGMPEDQIKLVTLLVAGYPLALVLRYILHPSSTSLHVRHLFSSLSGLAIAALFYGWQVLALVGLVAVGYIILLVAPPQTVHRWSMGWAVLFLSAGNILSDYYVGSSNIRWTMMIMIQKLTYVGFSLYDGMGGNSKPLNKDQEKQKLTSVPSVLEYMSYCFNFHSVLVGPSVTMREHLDFMDGSNFRVASPTSSQQSSSTEYAKEPSALYPVLSKLLLSIFFVALYTLLADHKTPLPIDPSMNIFVKMAYFCLACFVIRSQLHFAFHVNDSISNVAGLGFEGYDEQNRPKWGLASDVDAVGVEFSMNARNTLNLWHITASRWIRRVVYERVSWSPTLASFLFSAWWHGFHPGYYLGFLSLGLSVMAAKKMRRWCNPFFTSRGPVLKWTYHIATWVLTQLFVGPMVV
ncbi:Lysophospholipid acyltransferase 2 [Geodia barretti]|uniref:Lysophospholipid acyltransferase 2 n=1 Tax=Geodia barretti TaxID=519541 RepID=A0AA35X9V5_GEOBA|nr:Lysophospholipid acyltransferase 2 [Geodia barretti]